MSSKPLSLLVFSDLHMHAFRMFADFNNPSGDNSRRLEIANRLNEIVETANDFTVSDGRYDALVFAGDFFHERLWVDVVSVSIVKNIMKNLRIPFVACSGTHDMTYSGHSSLEVFKDMFVRRFWIDEDYEVPDTNWTIVAVPHIRNPEEHMNEIIRRAKRSTPAHKILLVTHGDIVGASYGGGRVERGLKLDEISSIYNYSVIGHIHNPQQARNRYGNILIPGACIPHNFGDEGTGVSWSLLENDGLRAKMRATPINYEHPKFITAPVEGPGSVYVTGSVNDYHRFIAGPDVDEVTVEPAGMKYVVVKSSRQRTEMETSDAEETADFLSAENLIQRYVDQQYEGLADFGGLLEDQKLKRLGMKLASDFESDTLLEEIEQILF